METTPCPKCGQEIPSDAVDCPFCGIVVAKFRNAPPRPEPSGAHAPAEASPPSAAPATATPVTAATATAGSGLPATATPETATPETATPPPAPADREKQTLYDPNAPAPMHNVAGGAGGFIPTSPYGSVTDTMIEHLTKTGPWSIFISLLIFLSAVFLGLGALLGSPAPGGQGVLVRLISGAFAILYLLLALNLFNFGQSARMVGSAMGAKSSIERIEEALQHQRAFWRLSGIVALVFLAFMVLALVGGILIGMAFSQSIEGP